MQGEDQDTETPIVTTVESIAYTVFLRALELSGQGRNAEGWINKTLDVLEPRLAEYPEYDKRIKDHIGSFNSHKDIQRYQDSILGTINDFFNHIGHVIPIRRDPHTWKGRVMAEVRKWHKKRTAINDPK